LRNFAACYAMRVQRFSKLKFGKSQLSARVAVESTVALTVEMFVHFLRSICKAIYALMPLGERDAAIHCEALQHVATRCNTLQYTTTRCNTLQHTTPQQHVQGDLRARAAR